MDELLEQYTECLADIEVAKKRQAKELDKRKAHEANLELLRVKIENKAGDDDYKSDAGKVSHRKGTPKLIIEDEKLIPSEWFITKETTTLSKQAILATLKMGNEVEGAKLSNGRSNNNDKGIDMTDYDNTNTGALFRNKDKVDGDNKPNYKGTVNMDGKEMNIAGWMNTSKGGVSYMSLKLSEIQRKDTQHQKSDEVPDLDEQPF